jgi:chromosome segregation ATPase
MKTQKTVMSKIAQISKEELSKEVSSKRVSLGTYNVSLNVQQDIAKKFDELEDELSELARSLREIDDKGAELRDARDNFDKVVREAKESQKAAQGEINETKKLKQRVESAAKELGVDAKAVKGYDLIDDYISDLQEEIKKVDSFIKQVK